MYLFNADNGKTVELCQSSNGSLPTALQWTINGTHLAVGFSDAELQVNIYLPGIITITKTIHKIHYR